MKWFKHDSNAHTDTKLKKLRHKHGIEGYGLYWYCLELIAGRVSKDNITFELEDDAKTIATDWNMDQVIVQDMMLYMCELGLFSHNNHTIKCLKLAKRLDDTNSKNPEIRAILSLLNNDSEGLRETPTNSDQTRLDENRLDENKKESKPKKRRKPFAPPSYDEVVEYVIEKGGTTEIAKRAFDHYDASGWIKSNGQKVLNWKQTLITNWINQNESNSHFQRSGKNNPKSSIERVFEDSARVIRAAYQTDNK